MAGMLSDTVISEDDVRASLVARALRYAEAANTSLSAIGVASVGDSKFISRVQAGLNFNIKTYQRVMDWLDLQEGIDQFRGAE
ncbi:hypothetical protein ACRQ1B_28845 [Rhizobium panacihumi]|uniref:hypothetical protein n=1 Tax=Rhizobium panacihumi TaxID=2008450 RepID=UPI003D7C05CA